ncbi:cupin-like domain-containing protein [Asticcacaulis sp. AND118]|uniref:cupin-like domain-containing protein n=1 Tax=Asticcacaulis sp. AND118 TaxID=2840468 RepID=UPI001CFFBF75|nr:cupin-like domain-containing protein [Asticcacaulis sp. AND118]UDF05507.1 cupin-like domain-containing protein [Asticcacaulis sp. AND118]
MTPARVIEDVTPARFAEALDAAKPAVFRGLVADWPIVAAARRSDAACIDYLAAFDAGLNAPLSILPPEADGLCHYEASLTGVNFRTVTLRLEDILQRLLHPPADGGGYYVQSLPTETFLPRFAGEHPLPLLPAEVRPRLWLGTAVATQTHYDLMRNIACVAAGRRRFTLFPPDQLANLYPGPDDFTPGGAPLSLPDIRDPDFARWPRLEAALATAQVAELEPGDALYIPYGWWHQVQSLSPFNALVNYWWNEADPTRPLPRAAFKAALVALKDLPEDQKAVWRGMFDLFIFGDADAALAHLPPEVRGAYGELTPQRLAALKAGIAAAFR